MSIDVKWQEGAPEKLEPGMLVKMRRGPVLLVGHDPRGWTDAEREQVARWAWLMAPYEYDWIVGMERAHSRKAGGQ